VGELKGVRERESLVDQRKRERYVGVSFSAKGGEG